MNGIDETARNGQTVQIENLKVVLNGGSDIMESATIPFQWFFSDRVIEQQPTHLLVIDQTGAESRGPNDEHLGERCIAFISHGSDFLQFTSPGRHRMAFIACKWPLNNVEPTLTYTAIFLRMQPFGGYNYGIRWTDIERLSQGVDNMMTGLEAVAAAIVEVEVPQEFFAQKPESAFGRKLWDWVNLWHQRSPRDECGFRKRMLLAFTIQPPVVAVLKVLQFGLYAPLASLFLILARCISFFVGYRPVPIFQDLSQFWEWQWSDPQECEWNVRRWGRGHSYDSYGVWIPHYEAADEKARYMPITGSEIVGIVVGCASWILASSGVIWAVANFYLPYGQLASVLLLTTLFACVGFFLFGIVVEAVTKRLKEKEWYKRLCNTLSRWRDAWRTWRGDKRQHKRVQAEVTETKQKLEERRTKQRHFLYFEWLREELHISKTPPRVEIKKLPPAFKGRAIQRFRVKYWDIKSRICRPYSR